jgi:hypothetical protein
MLSSASEEHEKRYAECLFWFFESSTFTPGVTCGPAAHPSDSSYACRQMIRSPALTLLPCIPPHFYHSTSGDIQTLIGSDITPHVID